MKSVIRSSFPSDSHSRVLNPPDTRKVFTESNLCYHRWGAPSCPIVSMQVFWFRPLLVLYPYLVCLLVLVKDCIDLLNTPITSIINLSLTEGSSPSHFKSAHVSPLLKKPSRNKDSMKNYQPVSNLSFLSKVLEEISGKPFKFTPITSSNPSK